MDGHQRGLAFLGFYSSASSKAGSSSQGLALLMSKKRDANEALRKFLDKRVAKGGPLMPLAGDGILVPVSAGSAQSAQPGPPREEVLENLARHSPTFDGSSTRLDSIMAHLSVMDGVRDKAFWSLLQSLASALNNSCNDMRALLDSLKDLDKLLRVHNLLSLTPLIRRALLCTWMSSDQVFALLDLWSSRWPEAFERDDESAPQQLSAAARACAADLPKFFVGDFLGHADRLVKIATTSADDARAALKALASIAKWTEALGAEVALVHAEELSNVLLEACQLASTETSQSGVPCRKAVKALKLLHDREKRALAAESWLTWARGKLNSGNDKVLALTLAAALFEQDFPGGLFHDLKGRPDFLADAHSILTKKGGVATDLRFAAIECVAAAGSEEDILDLLSAPEKDRATETDSAEATSWFDPEASHVVCCLLRVLRSGRLQMSTKMLSQVASKMYACLGETRPTCESETIFDSLQRLQRSSGSKVRLADRLRLCHTLPLIFAFSPVKKHREAVQRMLQASFTKASRRAEEPLVEFAIACFIHFLSSVDVFQREVSLSASSFPNSSRMCHLLCEALLRSDVQHSMELAWTVLQVCDRTLDFVDRENPASDAIHKAASVLRYVIEKRCPSLAGKPTDAQVTRGRMPAELFAARRSTAHRALPGIDAIADKEMKEVDGAVANDFQQKGLSSPCILQTPTRQSLLKARHSPESSGPGRSSVTAVARPMASTGKTSLAVPPAWSSTSKKRRTS